MTNPLIDLKLTGDWGSIVQSMRAKATRVRPAIAKCLRAEAEYLAGAMRESFDKVEPVNAKITAFLKGSTKPLVNHGDLRNSIAVIPGGDDLDFIVGIPAGGDAVRLAEIHEYGITIIQQITEKQRRWMFANLPAQSHPKDGPSTGIMIIHIPARPFIGPTFTAEQAKSSARFMANLAKELNAA